MDADEVRQKYRDRWVVCTGLAIGVAAWRKNYLPPGALVGNRFNVVIAGSLDALARKLAEQDAPG